MNEWTHQCILCAARKRTTKLKHGHCCAACADRITANLRSIPELAAMAAASLAPSSGSTGSTSAAFGSRPPLNLAAIDPALTPIPGHHATLLPLLEEWERLIRDMRGLVPYGPASAARATSYQPEATLTGVVLFLLSQMEWAASEPGFPLEDYASEIHECVQALKRWDYTAEASTIVRCPTITDDGECGYRLRYTAMDEHVTCRRCNASRDVMTLIIVAMSDGRPVWMDPENASKWLGVSERTLRRMGDTGKITRSHGRYLVSSSLTESPMTATM